MSGRADGQSSSTRRAFLAQIGAAGVGVALARTAFAADAASAPADETTNIYFEKKLKAIRRRRSR